MCSHKNHHAVLRCFAFLSIVSAIVGLMSAHSFNVHIAGPTHAADTGQGSVAALSQEQEHVLQAADHLPRAVVQGMNSEQALLICLLFLLVGFLIAGLLIVWRRQKEYQRMTIYLEEIHVWKT